MTFVIAKFVFIIRHISQRKKMAPLRDYFGIISEAEPSLTGRKV